MYVSPGEATEKWCPMVRDMVSASGEYFTNRPNGQDKNHECIADDCMAWCWRSDPFTDNDDRLGYCGLAHK